MDKTGKSRSVLNAAHDAYGCLPAVHTGDALIDFERFYESVEWMADQLALCGVRPGSRVGLGIHTGWEFVLAWHVLLELSALVVPVDLTPVPVLDAVRGVDFVFAHADQAEGVEEAAEDVAAQGDCVALYEVAEDFVVADLGTRGSTHTGGGLLVDPLSGDLDSLDDLREAARVRAQSKGVVRGARVALQGDLATRDAMVLILACASAGACVAVDAPFGLPEWGRPPAS